MGTRTALSPASLPPGTEVGPWRVVSLRGAGSYGAVYRVQKVGEEQAGPFALKLALRPLDPRFEREAEVLSRIGSLYVPQLHDQGWWVPHGGAAFPYLVMEWLEGSPLYKWAARRALSSRQVLQMLAQVARALVATHAAEGVHRDVKGDNVLVLEGGARAVLVDFGSALLRGARRLTWHPPPPGTPQYQSPESLRFEWQSLGQRSSRYEAQPADDVYAMGVMAYRLVTGRYPPPAMDVVDDARGGSRLVHPSLVRPEMLMHLSPELAALIRQMLAPEPSARGTPAELAHALEQAARSKRRAAQRPITPLPPRDSGLRQRLQLTLRRASSWAPWLAAAMGIALAMDARWLRRPSPAAPPASVGLAEASAVEDTETSGAAESVLEVPGGVKKPEPAPGGLARQVPEKPLPGQRRPPCEKLHVEIKGGCWARAGDEPPPCSPSSYEWKGGCYSPILGPPQAPNSTLP
jgi:eukaryotic-like serine/threonine-protein kinase